MLAVALVPLLSWEGSYVVETFSSTDCTGDKVTTDNVTSWAEVAGDPHCLCLSGASDPSGPFFLRDCVTCSESGGAVTVTRCTTADCSGSCSDLSEMW